MHYYSPLKPPHPTPISLHHKNLAAAMASSSSSSAIFIISLLLLSTIATACPSCSPPKPKPKPKPKPCPSPAPVAPTPTPPTTPSCPKDVLKLGVCADLLGLVNIVVGTPPSSKCCALLEGLADLEAALCLCTAIKANVLGINLNVPITLSALISACGKSIPPGFMCA